MKGVLFCRIGWMIRYAGPQPDDPKPVGGGSFNKKHLGHEAYNFLQLDGNRLEGYVQTSGGSPMRLDRINPDANSGKKSLDGVLVVFFAPNKTQRRQVVVGWYRDATVLVEPVWSGDRKRNRFGFNLKARRDKAVLLPPEDRELEVPRGRGGTGTSNVFYTIDEEGQPRRQVWMQRILKAIEQGAVRNALDGAAPTIENAVAVEIENATAAARGQGRLVNAAARREIEARAMKVASAHFSRTHKVTDVSKSRPYDLLCESKTGLLRVEVKGTQGDGAIVLLTRGEIRSARAAGVHALAVVSGIRLTLKPGKKWTATGGVLRICKPWQPKDGQLKPLAYEYDTRGLSWDHKPRTKMR